MTLNVDMKHHMACLKCLRSGQTPLGNHTQNDLKYKGTKW